MRNVPLIIILGTVFIALIGFGIVIPLLPVYAERYGASGFTVGMLMMIYSLMQFLLAPVAGKISDRIGRRPVIIISLLITAASYILFGLAQNLTILFISRFLAGIGGADITVAQAYIADVTAPKERSRGMGLFGAAFGIGFVIGPMLGGILAPYGQAVAPFVAAALSSITAIFAIFALPEPGKHQSHDTPTLKSVVHEKIPRELINWSVIHFLFVFAQGQLYSMIVLFNVNQFGWAERENGYFMGMIGLCSAMIQGGVVGRVSQRFGSHPLILIGFLFTGTGMMLISFSTGLPLLIAGGIVNAFGFASVLPSLSSMASLCVPEGHQGHLLGVFQSAGSLGRIIAPVTGGMLFDHFSHAAPFVTGALIGFLLLIFSFPFVIRSGKRHHTAQSGIVPTQPV